MLALQSLNIPRHTQIEILKNERLVTEVRNGIDSCEVTNLSKIK